jgi:hypothetical protein
VTVRDAPSHEKPIRRLAPLTGSSMHSRWRSTDNSGETAGDLRAKPEF